MRRANEVAGPFYWWVHLDLGKTTLAMIIATEMGASLRLASGPAIQHAGDLASILSALQPGDLLFIDEIHRLARTVGNALHGDGRFQG